MDPHRRLFRLVAALLLLGLLAGLAPLIQPMARAAPLSTQSLAAGQTPDALATSLLGGGITISNVAYTGANIAAGSFSGGADVIGFEGGVLLGSGSIDEVVGTNDGNEQDTDNAMPGDIDLDRLTSGSYTTNDAAVLEFDFVPTTNQLSFQYVFSSEEYLNYVGSEYNDVFGFFVNGTNCALVNGQPVSINTINRGQTGTDPGVNGEFYINNMPPDSGGVGPLATTMNGLTTVLTCQATVNPGMTNHLKLAVADTSDFALDTNVFIKAGSLTAKANQTITFAPLPDRTLSDSPFTVAATASSGLPVTFTADPATVCTAGGANGATITLVGVGTCTVTAQQAGDATYNVAPDVPHQFDVTGQAGQAILTLVNPTAINTVALSPAGSVLSPTSRGYATNTLVTLTPQPAADQTFIGWTVDGQAKGWARPLTITMITSHIVEVTFVPTPRFGDFQAGDPAIQPVIELAARGFIKGCDQTVTPPSFCSGARIKRAETAGLLVRGLGWSGEPSLNPFKDRCDPANPTDCIDQELWDAIGILFAKGVTRGYTSDADCGGPGTAPCFRPRDELTSGQVILFISRAMTAKGYWLGPLADIPSLFPELPQGSEAERQDRLSIVAYVFFAGGPPDVDASPGQPFASIGTPSTRGWFARALWQALDSYWGVDLPKNHGGYVP